MRRKRQARPPTSLSHPIRRACARLAHASAHASFIRFATPDAPGARRASAHVRSETVSRASCDETPQKWSIM